MSYVQHRDVQISIPFEMVNQGDRPIADRRVAAIVTSWAALWAAGGDRYSNHPASAILGILIQRHLIKGFGFGMIRK